MSEMCDLSQLLCDLNLHFNKNIVLGSVFSSVRIGSLIRGHLIRGARK